MTGTWNNWRAARTIFFAGAAVLLLLFYKPDEQRSAHISAEAQADGVQEAARLATLGHPHARVSDIQAFYTCRSAVKRLSQDPGTAVVPLVGWMKGGADWRFAWNADTQMVRMRNAAGADVAAAAVCVADEVSGDVKLLVLDGQEHIGPNAQFPPRLVGTR